MPAAGGCSRLTALVGPARAKQVRTNLSISRLRQFGIYTYICRRLSVCALFQVILVGDRVSADTAHNWGIVQYICLPGEQQQQQQPLTTALGVAERILRQKRTACEVC